MNLFLRVGFRKRGGAVPPPPAFTPEYQAVLDAATLLGYTHPSNACKTLQNQLIVDLKNDGVWSRLRALNVWAHDSTDDRFGLIDWVNPSLTWSKINTPSFTSKVGYSFGGVSGINSPYNYNQIVNTNFLDEFIGNISTGVFIRSTGSGSFVAVSGTLQRILFESSTTTRLTSGSSSVNTGTLSVTDQLAYLDRNQSTQIAKVINGVVNNFSLNEFSVSAADIIQFGVNRNAFFSSHTLGLGFIATTMNLRHTEFTNNVNSYMSQVILLP